MARHMNTLASTPIEGQVERRSHVTAIVEQGPYRVDAWPLSVELDHAGNLVSVIMMASLSTTRQSAWLPTSGEDVPIEDVCVSIGSGRSLSSSIPLLLFQAGSAKQSTPARALSSMAMTSWEAPLLPVFEAEIRDVIANFAGTRGHFNVWAAREPVELCFQVFVRESYRRMIIACTRAQREYKSRHIPGRKEFFSSTNGKR